jgi:hypothetical protein
LKVLANVTVDFNSYTTSINKAIDESMPLVTKTFHYECPVEERQPDFVIGFWKIAPFNFFLCNSRTVMDNNYAI